MVKSLLSVGVRFRTIDSNAKIGVRLVNQGWPSWSAYEQFIGIY